MYGFSFEMIYLFIIDQQYVCTYLYIFNNTCINFNRKKKIIITNFVDYYQFTNDQLIRCDLRGNFIKYLLNTLYHILIIFQFNPTLIENVYISE